MGRPDTLAPCITVLAGTNGAGKSSIAGEAIRSAGETFFNPDAWARALRAANPDLSIEKSNELAWDEGRRSLQKAIANREDFAFETTLGGSTIPRLLANAAAAGLEVRIWFAGLRSPDLHLARVRARVSRGGHDIPEEAIRKRYVDSLAHLIELLPAVTELWLYDNSAERPPDAGVAPEPLLVLHLLGGRIVAPRDVSRTPDWAKPVVAAALKLNKRRRK